MYALSHSLAHRGPGATRARARWQPYASPSPSVSSKSISASYLNTPASSVSSQSPPSSQISSISDFDRCNNPSLTPACPTPRDHQLRDVQKARYVICLVDQAVKSLGEIWQPQDIPSVFLTSARVPFASDVVPPAANSHPSSQHNQHHSRNIQLPSPVSPTTQPSPYSPPSISPISSSSPTESCAYSQPSSSGQAVRSDLVPIRGFVLEVLRRSRTSGSVLQTALCYIEAVRSKIPELVQQEKSGQGVKGEQDLASRIVQAEEEEIFESDSRMDSEPLSRKESSIPQQEFAGSSPDITARSSSTDVADLDTDSLDTVRIHDGCAPSLSQSQSSGNLAPQAQTSNKMPKPESASFTAGSSHPMNGQSQEGLDKKPKGPSPPLPPLPPLPSPLLCPRRTFLASLILASKFMQDRCYSNRAWAKLSGLPPREIGRCERALGEALEWRLWVGRPAAAGSGGCGSGKGRPVARCRSEGDLSMSMSPGSRMRQLTRTTSHAFLGGEKASCSGVVAISASASSASGLRRSATLPTLPFGGAAPIASQDAFNPQWPGPSFPSMDTDPLPHFSGSFFSGSSHNVTPQIQPSWPQGPSPSHSHQGQYTIDKMLGLHPSPPTPALSFSPTSSSSSDGDRTVQMSAFCDADVPTPLMQSFPPLPPLLAGSGPDQAKIWHPQPVQQEMYCPSASTSTHASSSNVEFGIGVGLDSAIQYRVHHSTGGIVPNWGFLYN